MTVSRREAIILLLQSGLFEYFIQRVPIHIAPEEQRIFLGGMFFYTLFKALLVENFCCSCAGFLLIPLIRSISGVGNGDRIASPFTSRWKESLNEYNKFDCQICE